MKLRRSWVDRAAVAPRQAQRDLAASSSCRAFRSGLEQSLLEAMRRGNVFVAVARCHERGVFGQHRIDHWQGYAEARRHVAANPEILGMQLDAKAGRITATHHVRGAMHEVPARTSTGP